ncbi:helix-turn-helix domain-containing protein [Candidatus Ulvibacter alkanivorans]|uniref:helix-turn-helix domain-containing protein n=1 Tax=Candidatus Ulvibacter alkanivorans TaxID=2267620 RepID=UPI000DF21068|nr:helix-turn-helix transcriptional regulator [Candidatus Ulvibacter alkanivorans]
MIHSRTLLKDLRTESPLDQKDVAVLLEMKASNLVRYEHGHRNPPPELLLTYHMLFDASLRELFAPIYKHIADTLIARSQKLIAEFKAHSSSKNVYKLSYLSEIVNRLKDIEPYGSRDTGE